MAQKLFIGGLPFSVTSERLREVFAAAGTVESATVVTDSGTGRSRGFGFVEMATVEERLQEDLGDEGEGGLALTAKADPVLADLWDNPKDAAYDRL